MSLVQNLRSSSSNNLFLSCLECCAGTLEVIGKCCHWLLLPRMQLLQHGSDFSFQVLAVNSIVRQRCSMAWDSLIEHHYFTDTLCKAHPFRHMELCLNVCIYALCAYSNSMTEIRAVLSWTVSSWNWSWLLSACKVIGDKMHTALQWDGWEPDGMLRQACLIPVCTGIEPVMDLVNVMAWNHSVIEAYIMEIGPSAQLVTADQDIPSRRVSFICV